MEHIDILGQRVDKPKVWELGQGIFYIGQAKENEHGEPVKDGLGMQLNLTEEGSVLQRYEGDWEGDLPHGKGELTMDDEKYEGEFYKGAANGKGTYRFSSGDFFEGEFTDGEIVGEGTYFTANGEAVDGTFAKGMLLIDGLRIPPFLPEKERDQLAQRILEGRTADNGVWQKPELQEIKTSDGLVSLTTEAVKQRQTLVIVRSVSFGGTLDSILSTLERKKAKFLFFSARDLTIPSRKVEWLFGLREALEEGLLILLNVDYRTGVWSEFDTFAGLESVISPQIFARDSPAIIAEFEEAKLDPPQLIHPDFTFLLLCSHKCDTENPELASDTILKVYPWLRKSGKVALAAIKELEKPVTFLQTALLEESLYFENRPGVSN